MKKNIGLVLAVLLLASCASKLHRGVVAMKVGDHTAHVGLKKGEVSVGDHVELFTNQCNQVTGVMQCKKVSIGHGDVTEIISDDYVSVKFEDGVKFREGDFIEKHSH